MLKVVGLFYHNYMSDIFARNYLCFQIARGARCSNILIPFASFFYSALMALKTLQVQC